MAQVLYVWACLHELGYRQGMHELAAWLWDVRATDAARGTADTPGLALLLRADAVEADTFFLVSSVLGPLQPFFRGDRLGTPAFLKALLHRVDAPLARHLASLPVEWAPVLVRWQRTLYLNEFAQEDVLALWDALFRADPPLELVQYVSAAMVVRQRDALLQMDFPQAMHLLLHYGESHTSSALLVDQAAALRASSTPETGAAVVQANHAAFGTALRAPRMRAERWLEMAGSGAERLAHEWQSQRGPNDAAPAWSPGSEARLASASQDQDTQRERAMLSFRTTY